MALVDPRLLDALRSQPPPPSPTDTVGKIVQTLDEEMKTILDRKDLDDGTKVTLYNQVLQRYNGLVDKRVKEPIRTISVNESTKGSKTRDEDEEEDTPIRRLEATVLDTVPKSLQVKARRLMEHLKRNVAWSDRGELVHEGVPIAGSNAVDLVHDLLRKRKTDAPTGWRSLAKQLRTVNIPMELIGNAARRTYIQTDSLSLDGLPLPRVLSVAHENLYVGHPSRVRDTPHPRRLGGSPYKETTS